MPNMLGMQHEILNSIQMKEQKKKKIKLKKQ